MPLQISGYRRLKPSEPLEQKEFVVKSLGNPSITTGSLFNECLGLLLAIHFKIPVPRPALINISQAFADTVSLIPSFRRACQDQELYGRASLTIPAGIAFGTEFLPGLAPVRKDIRYQLPKDLAPAARLFAFDMLTQNPDRTHIARTNCALHNNRLFAFDFELCFSFLFIPPSLTAKPWVIDDKMAREHIFHPSLKAKHTNWTPFFDDLSELSSDKIKQSFAQIPTEWNTNGDRILEHLMQVRDHAPLFRKELERVTF